MSRPIKFRAYDEEEKRFIYSDQTYDDHWFDFVNGTLKAFGLQETAGSIDEPPDVASRELSEPQEFTGLKDKTGREIYEGDIIQYTNKYHPFTKPVEFDSGCFWLGSLSFADLDHSYFEVAGNIYETK